LKKCGIITVYHKKVYLIYKENSMTKTEINLYLDIEKRLELESKKLLYWYNENIRKIWDIDELEFECIEGNKIFYTGYVCNDSIGCTIPIELLYLDTRSLSDYASEYKRKDAVKNKEIEEEKKAEKRLKKNEIEKGEKELYLILKKKYGDSL